MTTVSILTPSYNQGRFIGDCLASVANQTYPVSEHIVMDGGSTDSTLDVLRAAGSNVVWESERDEGQSHALNKAFSRSTGEIIGWLNSDDAYADRRAVQRAVEIFDANPDVGLVYGHSLMIDAENRVLQVYWSPSNAQQLLPIMTSFTQPAVFLRRSVLNEPFVRQNLHFVMDRDLWQRLSKKTRFKRLDLMVGIDRHHGDRKVESPAYIRERNEYYGAAYRTAKHLALVKALKVAMRLRAILPVTNLRNSLEPAFGLRFDSPLRLAARQGLVPRRFMA